MLVEIIFAIRKRLRGNIPTAIAGGWLFWNGIYPLLLEHTNMSDPLQILDIFVHLLGFCLLAFSWDWVFEIKRYEKRTMTPNQKLTILQGLPCSGKSTFARQQVAKHDGVIRVNRDSLRAMLYNSEFSGPNERLVEKIRDTIITESLSRGYSVIVDDTNLNPKVVRRLKNIGKNFGVLTETIHFSITAEEAWERELKRREEDPSHVHVPKHVIENMDHKWQTRWKNEDTTV